MTKEEKKMDRRLSSVVWSLLGIPVVFALVIFVLGNMLGIERFQTDNYSALRFGFVILGLLIALLDLLRYQETRLWEVGARQGRLDGNCALSMPSFRGFNVTVFVVPR
jgi:hypothetical protein